MFFDCVVQFRIYNKHVLVSCVRSFDKRGYNSNMCTAITCFALLQIKPFQIQYNHYGVTPTYVYYHIAIVGMYVYYLIQLLLCAIVGTLRVHVIVFIRLRCAVFHLDQLSHINIARLFIYIYTTIYAHVYTNQFKHL